MGMIYADIELVNVVDQSMAKKHLIGEEEVKRMKVSALVDTGCIMLAINEAVQEVLQLDEIGIRPSRMANDEIHNLMVVGPVEVRYMGRTSTTNAFLLPGSSEVLLGAIPMEEMDVYPDPRRQALLPHHPEGPILSLR